VVYGCLYFILSSLPVTEATYSAVSQFYGLGPSSLASGAIFEDLQGSPLIIQESALTSSTNIEILRLIAFNLSGHSFWDTEIWIFPVIVYFYPEAARELLNYRLLQVKAARDRAAETGYRGVKFPWEGGISGNDVTPECCPQNKDLQIHITGDVAFAIRQYIAITKDIEWLRETQPNHITNACGLIREIAEFWISRAKYNHTTRLYDINGMYISTYGSVQTV
jgi:trehalose/maltose hydrolase-like predicted phosphorylase